VLLFQIDGVSTKNYNQLYTSQYPYYIFSRYANSDSIANVSDIVMSCAFCPEPNKESTVEDTRNDLRQLGKMIELFK
jgi:hypothetical protein